MENIGVFDLLERLGLSYAEKLKSSSASNWLMTYLLYEVSLLQSRTFDRKSFLLALINFTGQVSKAATCLLKMICPKFFTDSDQCYGNFRLGGSDCTLNS